MVEGMNKSMQSRLNQARESLDEAKDLLVRDADVNFVMNSLYYAFLYALWGLLELRGISAPAHSTAISLFEQEFVLTGKIEERFHDALREAFDLRPACSCEGKRKATVEDVEQLLPVADEFLDTVGRFVG
jgi:uncharacterized protein (UPF0332 family)